MAVYSPFDALSSKLNAEQQWDADETRRRQTRTYGPGDIGQQQYFNTFNDMQTDAATGPTGYNRQWVPLLQSLKGKRLTAPRGVDPAPGLPTSTYADLEGTGHMTRLDDASVAALKARAEAPPVDDFAANQRLMYGDDPNALYGTGTAKRWPDFYHGPAKTGGGT